MTVLFKVCIYTGIIVSLIFFSLSAHSTDDDFLTTLMTAPINAAVWKSKSSHLSNCKKDEEAKVFIKRLLCGSEGYNVQHNYYILYIDEGQTPADTPPVASTGNVLDPRILQDSDCGPNAKIIGPSIIKQGDIPEEAIPAAEIEAEIKEKKLEKKIPVFYRITIKNGAPKETNVYIAPICEK